MHTYPINLIGLAARLSVVIGGGVVALRKVEGLLDAGAQVTVIAPEVTAELQDLAQAGRIRLVHRTYVCGDLEGAWVVVAATDDPQVNRAVSDEAGQRGCLVNVVDQPQLCNFIVPAIVRRQEVVLAVSTGGGSPALARRLRERLAELIGPEYGLLGQLLAELRPELRARFPAGEPRLQAALHLVDSDLLSVLQSSGTAAARVRAQGLLDGLETLTPSHDPGP